MYEAHPIVSDLIISEKKLNNNVIIVALKMEFKTTLQPK